MTRKVLMASPNDWHSPFQVGSQKLARCFVRAGWQVAYISDPLSPWHLARGWTADVQRRATSWVSGGITEAHGSSWATVPFALATPHSHPLLRSRRLLRSWHRLTIPNLVEAVRKRGFGDVDLLYIDSLSQGFWLDAIQYQRSVLRVADYSPHLEKWTPALRDEERALAQAVDVVVYPSPPLRPYVESLGARRTLCLPNGVDLRLFTTVQPAPPEYAGLSRPIAVYVGILPEWFHYEWLRAAARHLPGMSFVLIGPEQLARRELGGMTNVHLLGHRDHRALPAYLQHADVGLMPFDLERNPRGVECLNPGKYYQYLASGLPVVSSDWPALQELGGPAHRCHSLEMFIDALREVPSTTSHREQGRQLAAAADWQQRWAVLMAALGWEDGTMSGAAA